ncbi:MAG: hypothetical protein RO009_22770 [Pseudorhodoplanes sp.]|jgi:hypothetical protein|nr:hypothetical protein [Pseudorhodoplanes sp.]
MRDCFYRFWHHSNLARCLLLVALAVAVIGLPLNHLVGYALLAFVVVVAFVGDVSVQGRAWRFAGALALVALAANAFLAPPRIDEGHNIFLVKEDSALLKRLPPDVYRIMAAEFDKAYPPERRCNPAESGCWRTGSGPASAFAFSADGIFDKGEFSRRVDDIDFADPVWLRLGFTNESIYNWDGAVSDLKRLRRDGRFWMGLHRWHLLMPYFVMYRFPSAFAGSQLCWQGDVIWEERAERFTLLSNAAWACRTIERSDIGLRIFGLGIRPGSLAMTLDPPVVLRGWQIVFGALKLIVLAAIVGALVRWRRRATVLPFLLIASCLFVIAIHDASFIGGFRPLDAGDDGLFYEGTARNIVQNLLSGHLVEALRGGESVFYYGGPGFRYLRAFERFVFGDTNLGYLALILALPFTYLALFRRFLSRTWALGLTLVFVLIPTGELFGTSFFHFSRWAARGFADPAAAVLALGGLVLLVRRTAGKTDMRFGIAAGAGLLMALAIFVRPNLAPFVGVMLAGAGVAALYTRNILRAAGLCVGFLPAAVMPLHNWYFGGVFVLFSSNASIPELLVMPPSAWGAALMEILRLDLDGPHVLRALKQLGLWLSGPGEILAMIPVHAAAIVAVIYVAAASNRFDSWLRLIAFAVLVQHAASLIFLVAPRYHYLAWLLTFLVTAAWFEEVGIAWLRHKWPAWFRRMRRSRLNLALAIGLTRLDRLGATAAGR